MFTALRCNYITCKSCKFTQPIKQIVLSSSTPVFHDPRVAECQPVSCSEEPNLFRLLDVNQPARLAVRLIGGTFNTRKMIHEISTFPLPYLTRLFMERSKLFALQLVEVKLYYDSNSNSDKSTNQMQQSTQFIT
jgi:hypothetical protein